MLKAILVSEVRQKILGELFSLGQPALHIRDLTRRVGTEINAIRRELKRLNSAGILRRIPRGNRVYYQVREDSPLFPELLAMVAKERGLGGALVGSAKKLGKIKFALLATAFVRGRQASSSDVDLLIVGACDLRELGEIVKRYQEKLGYEINYTVMGEEEFEFRKKRRDPFVLQILISGRIILVGDEDKYCSL